MVAGEVALMASYYAADRHATISDEGPVAALLSSGLASYDEAVAVHTDRIARLISPLETLGWEPAVLLDMGSVDLGDPAEVERLLLTDPVLHAIYEMGRQHGAHEAKQRQQ
jgi:hypothetical protein